MVTDIYTRSLLVLGKLKFMVVGIVGTASWVNDISWFIELPFKKLTYLRTGCVPGICLSVVFFNLNITIIDS